MSYLVSANLEGSWRCGFFFECPLGTGLLPMWITSKTKREIGLFFSGFFLGMGFQVYFSGVLSVWASLGCLEGAGHPDPL